LNFFGQKLKSLRESKGLLLRQLAARLEVDAAFICNIEVGRKKATRAQVEKLTEILEIDKSELIPLWLSDKICEMVENEPLGNMAIEIASNLIKKNHE
jgi:transcriptional regulator with XRE-family HTH domain